MAFSEFEETTLTQRSDGHGDVKYHLGYENTLTLKQGQVFLKLAHNPSHLELINSPLEGMAYAQGEKLGTEGHKKVLPILVHGEAAFTGQGMVAEALTLTRLPEFNTEGTLHVVVNNQVGFTASAQETRVGKFATDIAKAWNIPVLHVNGDDPEAVVIAPKEDSMADTQNSRSGPSLPESSSPILLQY